MLVILLHLRYPRRICVGFLFVMIRFWTIWPPILFYSVQASGLFLYPMKASENLGFLIFPGDIEKHQQHEMGSKVLLPKLLF